MIRTTTVLFFILFSISFARGQQGTDSLRHLMYSGKTYQQKISAYKQYVNHFVLRDFDTALAVAGEGMKLARTQGDSISIAEFKKASGVAHYFKGHYNIAATLYYEAISILENSGEKVVLANTYNELAKLYRKTRDLDRALENYDKAELIFTQLKDTGGMAMIQNESGVVFEYREDYEEALKRYNRSRELAGMINNQLSVSYSLSNIAGVYTIQKNYVAAEENLLKALRIRQSLADSFATALTYSDLGVVMNAKGDFSKAKYYLSESNRMAKKLGYPELQSNNYNELAKIAEKQNDYKSALQYYQLRAALKDSLFAIEKTKQIEELNTRYETVKKQQKIDQQHDRIVRQNFLFLGLAGIALLAGLLIHSNYKRYKLKKEAQIQAEIRLQQELATRAVIEAEENERQRIAKDLHDGVGQMMSAAKMNLSAFESELDFENEQQRNSFNKIIELVDEGCREVRTVSHLMMPNVLLKKNLADAIHDFTDKLDKKSLQVHLYTEGIDERLDSKVETVLYRVIQECVNNVIKHAHATTLDISVIRDSAGIDVTIEDNGRGFDMGDKEKFEGIGLKNIITRVEFLKGTVDFDSAPSKGTAIVIHIPYKGGEI